MILFNRIINHDVDPYFIEDNIDLFEKECKACALEPDLEKAENCDECGGNGTIPLEPYQFFVVDVSEFDIAYLKEYGVNVGYSEKLDLHILPIYDYGTSWSEFSYSKEVEDNYTLKPFETLERTTIY